MSNSIERMSAARRKAEAMLSKAQSHERHRQEQETARDAMAEKTERLRALRLAKEAAERQPAAAASEGAPRRRVRRSKQT